MKIIIAHGKTKRKIDGAFNVCGSCKDLRSLARQILSRTENDFYYGWIEISNPQPHISNTEPVPWEDE